MARERVAENIRALMARRGVRQPQMMALLGLSQPAVSRRLNGQLTWNVDELEKVAKAFDVSIGELIDGAPGPRDPEGGGPPRGGGSLTEQYADHARLFVPFRPDLALTA